MCRGLLSRRRGTDVGMDIPAFAILGIVLIVFIAGGLLFAFVADRRRNEDVANDTERLDPDPTTPPSNPSDRHGG